MLDREAAKGGIHLDPDLDCRGSLFVADEADNPERAPGCCHGHSSSSLSETGSEHGANQNMTPAARCSQELGAAARCYVMIVAHEVREGHAGNAVRAEDRDGPLVADLALQAVVVELLTTESSVGVVEDGLLALNCEESYFSKSLQDQVRLDPSHCSP
jgi:hypothetical protein